MKKRPTINYLHIKTIVIKDANRKVDLEAQFNTEKFTITKEIDWTKEKAATRNWPTHEFSGGEAATFSLSLLFDTTQEEDSTEKDVRKYTNELFTLALYNADVTDYPDPPPVQVSWGPMVLFVAVVNKVEVTYVLFYPDGTPARARAEVEFSQYDISDDLKGATNPTSRTDARKTHIVQSGNRLDLLALERAEARAAMGMILDGRTRPEQTGAFLMLLRVKEETADEIAGFVTAARERARRPADAIAVDLDWPTYAGKRQEHPWYLLAALLLAAHGHRVLMHGCEPHALDRLFAAPALQALGIAPALDWREAGEALSAQHFAYAPLRLFSPGVQDLLNLRHLFGLRSPANTFARQLNPLAAPATMLSLQHPAYAARHTEAARLLRQPRAIVAMARPIERPLAPTGLFGCNHPNGGRRMQKQTGHMAPVTSGYRLDSRGALIGGIAFSALFTAFIWWSCTIWPTPPTFGAERPGLWYEWQLEFPTIWTRAAAWGGYLAHQLTLWWLIARARKLQPGYTRGTASMDTTMVVSA